ncbi:hypothetical protein [Heyndrickxia sporothermodurans]|uniref:hypothetical protein n=1 Tax=Heyndrickxia sporothermodurans TaxID=46224 RepID=UPI0015E659D4|nr:hypothetical protein [Heyndrickxia sporothermodurans]
MKIYRLEGTTFKTGEYFLIYTSDLSKYAKELKDIKIADVMGWRGNHENKINRI